MHPQPPSSREEGSSVPIVINHQEASEGRQQEDFALLWSPANMFLSPGVVRHLAPLQNHRYRKKEEASTRWKSTPKIPCHQERKAKGFGPSERHTHQAQVSHVGGHVLTLKLFNICRLRDSVSLTCITPYTTPRYCEPHCTGLYQLLYDRRTDLVWERGGQKQLTKLRQLPQALLKVIRALV